MDYQEIITKLEQNSVWFSTLLPKQRLFVAEYCTNGFDADKAAKVLGGSRQPSVYLEKEPIQEAIKEFVSAVLVDKAYKLESKIMDTLWRRAFYSPLDFINGNGEPLTADGSPFDPDNFDLKEYKERLGDNACVIDNIKNTMHPRNPDFKSVVVVLADRNQALKQLSQYAGLAKEEDANKPSSFVVNVNMNEPDEYKQVKIHEFKGK
jgi:hypothetical protein